jgi:hypothetical protein
MAKTNIAEEVAKRIHRAIPSVAVHVSGGFGISLRPTTEVQQSKSSHSSTSSDVLITTKRGAALAAIAVCSGNISAQQVATLTAHAAMMRAMFPHISYGVLVANAAALPTGLAPESVSFAIALGTNNSDWKAFERLTKRQVKLSLFAYKASKSKKSVRPVKRMETVVKIK